MIIPNAGSDYFFLNDDLRNKVNQSNLNDFKQVYEKFFKNLNKGTIFRCITGKTVEPAACKTPLIMVKGDYKDFIPNTHYIELNEDYSNIEECMNKLNDLKFVNSMIENSYKLIKSKYLYTHLLDKLYNFIKIKF